MPYFIRTHKVWETLRKRFDLVISQPTQEKLLEEFIIPVTDADAAVRLHKVDRRAITTTGAGLVNAYVCPDGKRVLIKAFEFINNVGTATITRIEVLDISSSLSIGLWTGSAAQPVKLPMDSALNPFWLEPGDMIRVTISATGTSAWGYVLIEEEEVAE